MIFDRQTNEPAAALPDTADALNFRQPVATDGPNVTRLIADCPPLDGNSAYCNLLQCTHFAATCILAETATGIAGWISGYRLPADAHSYFLWQVAVAPTARGRGLAQQLLDALLQQPAMAGVQQLLTSITSDNAASWATFRKFARRHAAQVQSALLFDSTRHFADAHASEWQLRIGPLRPSAHPTFSHQQTGPS